VQLADLVEILICITVQSEEIYFNPIPKKEFVKETFLLIHQFQLTVNRKC
jgi:hypothetical protein